MKQIYELRVNQTRLPGCFVGSNW